MVTLIETQRLILVPATVSILRADLQGRDALSRALQAEIAPEWPPEHFDADAINWTIAMLEGEPASYEWGMRYFVLRQPKLTLIGVGGYKGPAKNGAIELGYSVVPAYQRRGYATEATRAMVRHAFIKTDVERVLAHTLPELVPSIGVLEKCAFTLQGAGAEAGTIRYALTRREWNDSR